MYTYFNLYGYTTTSYSNVYRLVGGSNHTTSCLNCPIGKYSSNDNFERCKECNVGKFLENTCTSDTFQLCPNGTEFNTSLLTCTTLFGEISWCICSKYIKI